MAQSYPRDSTSQRIPPDPTSMSLSLASSVAASRNTLVPLTLGRSANAIELLVPAAPAVHDAPDLKARCFDFMSDLLLEHAAQYSSAELIAACNHIPGSSYNANQEAATICSSIRSAFFTITNLTDLGFRDHQGRPLTTPITVNPTNRPTGITYFAFRATVDPSTIDSRITKSRITIEFWLALPQTILNVARPASDPGRRTLTFETPAGSLAPSQASSTVRLSRNEMQALSAADLADLGSTTGDDTLADYDPDGYDLFTPTQFQTLYLRMSRIIPVPAPAPDPILLSPRMSAVLASTTDSSSSYFGSLEFLDSQSEFDRTFPNPIPLIIPPSTSNRSVPLSIDSASVSTVIHSFIDQCKFQVFLPIFRSDYVGTANRDDAASLHATVQSLKKYSMSFRNPTSGQWTNLTPDELFAEYANLTPLLPPDVSLWGLNLVTQFHDALSLDLQELLMADHTYVAPNLASLTDRSKQLDALRLLRHAAVRHYSLQKTHEKLIARTVHRKMKHIPSALTVPFSAAPSIAPSIHSTDTTRLPLAPLSVPLEHPDDVSALTRSFMSPAEQTMQRYQPAAPAPSPSLPTDPITNFQSCYPLGFVGCMYCGASDHVFKGCSQKHAPGASATFFKHLFAHKPHLRQRPPLPSEVLPANPGTPITQSFPSPARLPPQSFPSPARLPPPLPPCIRSPPPPPIFEKRAKFFVQVVKSFSMHTLRPRPALPPMPIAIDNGLPHITFSLGSDPALDPTLCGLMDTCGALNTGYLLFHLWLMSERPDLVAEFISFDDSNPFEPIKLGGAIRDPSDFDAADHGNLTAVIRYYTPYTDVSGSPITLSFGLGSDVTVNTIFGLPMLCALDSVISLNSNSLHSRSLNTEFPITRAAATFGLPSDCSFDPATSSRHHDSLHGLHPSDAPLHSITPALTTACDDTSRGFLQRTVHPSL